MRKINARATPAAASYAQLHAIRPAGAGFPAEFCALQNSA